MAKVSQSRGILLLGALMCACSGEAATEDFGQGYPAGQQVPPASQQGEATPTPNFPDCSNACLACLDAAGDDDVAGLACIVGSACQAYLSEFIDSVGDYGSDGNILATPEGDAQGANDCDQFGNDDCQYCLCASDDNFDLCAPLCS